MNFQPLSLGSIVDSIKRHLKGKDYGYSLINCAEISGCGKVLKAKQKELKSLGKGNMPNAVHSLTESKMNSCTAKASWGMVLLKLLIPMLNTLMVKELSSLWNERRGIRHGNCAEVLY